MATEVQLASDQFLQAIAEYAEELDKDFPMAVNKKMRDAAFKASMAAPVANKAVIEQLRTPKFAALHLSKRPAERVRVKYRSYTGKLGKNWNKKYRTYSRWVTRHYSRQEAKKWMRSVIGRRKASATYVKAFFLYMAKAIEDGTPGLDKKMKRALKGGFGVGWIPAKPGDPSAYVTVSYSYRHSRSAKTAVDRILEEAWITGMDRSAADTTAYLEKKMSERARLHSVK